MKKWIVKKNRKNKKIGCFKKADLSEITEELKNPACGFYRIYTFLLENVFDEAAWRLYLQEIEDALVLLQIHLGAYRDLDLDEEALVRIGQILMCFAERGKDIILRFAYDFEGKGMEHEPDRFFRIEKHLEQLLPIIKEHSKYIYILQGVLLGSWGEMHTSKYLTSDYIRRIEETLAQVTLDEMEENCIYRAVRRPVFWRLLYTERESDVAMKNEKIGLYNDAILGSETDLGTYGEADREEWEEPWKRKYEISFIQSLGQYVPIGGEIVRHTNNKQHDLAEIVDTLRQMHISYLNRDHDKEVLNQWREFKWNKNDIWKGMNGWDYVARHLGYRFFLRDVTLKNRKEKCFCFEIENIGFSNLYQEAELFLEYENTEGEYKKELIQYDMRQIGSGERIKISHQSIMEKGKYYLSMRRKWDKKKVLFSNIADDYGRVFLGQII